MIFLRITEAIKKGLENPVHVFIKGFNENPLDNAQEYILVQFQQKLLKKSLEKNLEKDLKEGDNKSKEMPGTIGEISIGTSR